MSTYETENLTGLVSPAGLPDLLDAHVARVMAVAVTSVATGQYGAPILESLRQSEDYETYRPWLAMFDEWVRAQHGGDLDAWIHYMAVQAGELEKSIFSVYDPDGLIDDQTRFSSADPLIGSALWFSYLRQIGTIDEDDERRFVNLWCWLVVQDLLGDEPDKNLNDEW